MIWFTCMVAVYVLLTCSFVSNASQVIVSLFNAIRATRLAYLQKKHPTLHVNDVRQLFKLYKSQMDCHRVTESQVSPPLLQMKVW